MSESRLMEPGEPEITTPPGVHMWVVCTLHLFKEQELVEATEDGAPPLEMGNERIHAISHAYCFKCSQNFGAHDQVCRDQREVDAIQTLIGQLLGRDDDE